MEKTMKTFKEIERKFLLKRFPRLEKINTVYQIEQWYHHDGFRYRKQIELPTQKVVFFKTKKTNLSKGVNQEEETSLTSEEFDQLDLSNSLHIKKTRTVIKYKGHKFEIDKYDGINIIILEIELKDLEEKIIIPKYIDKEILYEVTGIKEFSNKKLSE
jgi:CYTH domain-containing protein